MTAPPTYSIHPAIGIARLGNSSDSFYIAPERTGAPPIDCGPDGIPIVQDGQEQPVTQYRTRKTASGGRPPGSASMSTMTRTRTGER